MEEDISQATQESHSWGNYHWARTSNPFSLDLGDNLNNGWDSYLSTASSDWSRSKVLNTNIVAGSSNPKNCKSTTGMVEVCNNTYGYNGWLGVAGISARGSHITAAYVKVNDSYFNSPTYNTPEWKNLVMCQEVGHAFGLGHQDEDFDNQPLGTCMDYSSDPKPNQHPDQHDYEQLEIIYDHLDSSSTVGTSSTKGPSVAFDVPAEWGELVSESRGGFAQTYVRDFGHGNKQITHVLWAME